MKIGIIKALLIIFIFLNVFFIHSGISFCAETPVINTVEEAVESFDFIDPFIAALPEKPIIEPVKPVSISDLPGSMGGSTVQQQDFNFSSLAVTGIVWGAQKPKAIINDEVVGVGSIIKTEGASEGAKIMSITREGILFRYNEKEFLMKRDVVIAQNKEIEHE